MPKWVKIALIVVLVLFAGVVAAVIVAARWVKTQAKSLDAQITAVRAEAEAFGRGRDAEACLQESLRRVRACSGIVCEGKTKAFMSRCLQVANVPPGYCSGVPGPMEITKVGQWQYEQCVRHGFATDRRCIGIIGEIPLYCSQKR